MKKFIIISALIILVVVILSLNMTNKVKNTDENANKADSKKEVTMLWDVPKIMNKSHNQILQILGNPTVIEKLSDGKMERFKFINGELQRFFEEDLPTRQGMTTTEYHIYYKIPGCELMYCGKDLLYSYLDSDQPIKYFSLFNTTPALSLEELKLVGNLNDATKISQIKIVPWYAKQPTGVNLLGLDICAKGYRGSNYEDGSENCVK